MTDLPKIPRIEIIRLLGRGAMGSVFQGRHTDMDRLVAVKVLAKITDEDAIVRFKREAQHTSLLNHPNIVKTLSFGVSEEQLPYLVLEYLQGHSLAEELKEHGRFSFERFRDVFLPILSALDMAHQQKIIHRDIKPANIMICTDPSGYRVPKLVDFGIAKEYGQNENAQALTKSGALLGSPMYMSPEQCQGKALDGRSDLYSLACVMYESLCGETPFSGESSLEIMQKHCLESPPTVSDLSRKIDIKKELAKITLSGLAKDPANRPQTAAVFAKELTAVLEKITLDRVPQFKDGRKRVDRKSIAILSFVFVAFGVLALSSISGVHRNAQSLESTVPKKQFQLAMALGQRSFAAKKWQEAEKAYLKAIQVASNKSLRIDDAVLVDVWNGLSLAMNRQDHRLDNEKLRELALLNPRNYNKRFFRLLAENGMWLRKQGDGDLAAQLHEKALEHAKKKPDEPVKILAMQKELAIDYALAGKVREAKKLVELISQSLNSQDENLATLSKLSKAQALVAIALATNKEDDIQSARSCVIESKKIPLEDGPEKQLQEELSGWLNGRPISFTSILGSKSEQAK